MSLTYTEITLMSPKSDNSLQEAISKTVCKDPKPTKYLAVGVANEPLNRMSYDSTSTEKIDPFLNKYVRKNSSMVFPVQKGYLLDKIVNKSNNRSFPLLQKYLSKTYKVDVEHDQIKQETWKESPSSGVQKLDITNRKYNKHEHSLSEPLHESRKKTSIPQSIRKTSASQTKVALDREFSTCGVGDLINLISRMLNSLTLLNDKSVSNKIPSESWDGPSSMSDSSGSNRRVLTRYHSRTPPGISLHTYITRLTKFNNFTPATLLTTIYYIDLLSHHYQPFFSLNSWTVHRFLLVATMISQKSMEDFFYTNDHYAKVGGVAIGELNCLELDFLTRVNWRCVPAKQLENGKNSIKYAKDVLNLYYSQLIRLMGKNISSNDSIIYCFKDESK